jgi:hypothetical protein
MTEALGDYRISEYEADRDGLSELSEIAEARASLEARLPKVVIRRGAGAAQATISLDGVMLGATSIGSEMAVDPGPHQVTARSPGKLDFELAVTANEGTSQTIEVVLEPASAVQAPPPLVDERDAEVAPRSLPPSPRSPWPWIASGAALASAGAGGYFLYARSRAIEVQKQYCVGGYCNENFRADVEDAEDDETRNGRFAVVAFSASGLFAAAAVTLWLGEAPTALEPATVSLAPVASDRDLAFVVRGTF